MLDEDETQDDTSHFERLRKLEFFTEFEDIELWEVLRISVWREVSTKVVLIREGDNNRVFGVIVDGFVEVSVEGKSLCRLRVGEIVRNGLFASERFDTLGDRHRPLNRRCSWRSIAPRLT